MLKVDRSTLVVGDIHGNTELVNLALATPYNVVFLGDFLDSFEYSSEDQVDCLRTVLDMCEYSDGAVQSILGNHERSYMVPAERCSGFNWHTASLVQELLPKMEEHLKPYIWVNGWLCSHAGISNKLLEGLDISYQQYLKDEKFLDVGRARGGYAPSGGLYWCDWWREFEPVPGLKQVVGHSSYRPYDEYEGIVEKGSKSCRSYNIDCLMRTDECLLIDVKGNVSVYNLKDNANEEKS